VSPTSVAIDAGSIARRKSVISMDAIPIVLLISWSNLPVLSEVLQQTSQAHPSTAREWHTATLGPPERGAGQQTARGGRMSALGKSEKYMLVANYGVGPNRPSSRRN
jgi:hypothetical protein